MTQDELQALAEEELAAACSLSFTELARVTPWGDSHRGFSPSGAEVEFERRYLWADQPDAILVEVEVRHPPDDPMIGAEAQRVIRKG